MSRAQRIRDAVAARGVAVAPSVLSADFARLGEEVRAAEAAGADLLHVDVMDGHFVPNLSIGVPVVKSLRRATELPLDVHLMIANPADFVEPFLGAGADCITFHVEAVPDPVELLERIRAGGAMAGLVLKPQTPVATIEAAAAHAEMVLVMSVEPGFSGQRFMPEVLPKVGLCRDLLGEKGLVEIDGGIDPGTAPRAVAAGAQVLVAGSAIFGTGDYARAVQAIRAMGSPEDVSGEVTEG